jgi:hypothetical protein
MAVRRFGPVRGAGTRIEEQEGAKTLSQSALGWAGYAGIFERGPVNKLSLMSTEGEFTKRYGGLYDGTTAPDCAQHYYRTANGAGGIAVVRVTDGFELASEISLYARRVDQFVRMGKIKAANGGRWGGKLKRHTSDLTASSDLLETTMQLEVASSTLFKLDELKGGYIELAAVANKRYLITGNSASGLITVASDSKMKTDWGAGPSLRYYLVLENEAKALSVRVDDGEEFPDTEFSVEAFLNGAQVRKWANLSTDPNSNRYWVNLINNDDANDYIVAEDLWTGAHVANVRPVNYYGKIASITATVLTATIHTFLVNSPTGGNPTFALGTTDNNMVEQTITITMTNATTGTAVSDKFGSIGGTVTLGTLFTPNNKWTPPFTVTAGATPLAATNTLVIVYKPFRPSALVGGYLFPDKVNNKRDRFRIAANDHKTITVDTGNDISAIGANNEEFAAVAPLELEGGRDGNSGIVDATYVNGPWNSVSSPFNDADGQNIGLIKFATPGVTATAVQKAGIAYAADRNHQYRGQFPSNISTESGMIGYVNDTIGRSDYSVWLYPGECSIAHPDPAAAREGKLKTVPTTGMVHGREARIAADWDGYHKAQAGVDATLPLVLKIPTGDRKLNEELLNPVGIAIAKKKAGNFAIWGDRTTHLDPAWKFKHQREQMSHYEHVLSENFDWLIFSINDADSDDLAKTALDSYFRPEWVKRALRGDKFEDAATIKVDSENNTDATRAAGDKFADVILRLADTTERFIIRIGKAGIFTDIAA